MHRLGSVVGVCLFLAINVYASSASPQPSQLPTQKPPAPASECGSVSTIPTLPFLRIAEYDGTNNISVADWRKPGRLHVDDDSVLILCVDPLVLASDRAYASSRISFDARIGSRPIEVQGYAEVGKATKPVLVGIRNVSLPELATFMSRVRGIPTNVPVGDETIIDHARDVLDSIGVTTNSDDVARATAEVLQTSVSDLTAKRAGLSNAVTAGTTAKAKIAALLLRLPAAKKCPWMPKRRLTRRLPI